jgi:hypothetical protein
METHSYRLGMAVAAAVSGCDPEEVLYKKATTETISNHQLPGYGAVQRMMCKYAADAYRNSGNMDKLAFHVYSELAEANPWWPTLDNYYDAAVSAVGKVHQTIRKEAMVTDNDLRFEKSAMGPATATASALFNLTPQAIKSILALGAATGVGGGALTWLANRSIAEDEPKLEAMRQKVDYYNQLTDEIEAQLAAKKSPVSEKELSRITRDII